MDKNSAVKKMQIKVISKQRQPMWEMSTKAKDKKKSTWGGMHPRMVPGPIAAEPLFPPYESELCERRYSLIHGNHTQFANHKTLFL